MIGVNVPTEFKVTAYLCGLLERHIARFADVGLMTGSRDLTALFATTKVLVVDDEHYMRKVIRTLLMSIGICTIYEAPDGPSGLETIRAMAPDVVIVDWQMPGLDGASFVRMVRSPGSFPYPDVPIIMLTGHGERSRVIEAVKIGVNEFLLKPVSAKSLHDRLVAVLANPRPIVQSGCYYGPVPRNLSPAVAAQSPRNLAVTMHEDGDEALSTLVMLN
jgi:two-component system chemotaxis response regulator CheY